MCFKDLVGQLHQNSNQKKQAYAESGPRSTETASGNRVRQFIDILNGISKEDSKKITNLVKSSKAKVQASVNGDEVRITGKKRDDLQAAITLIKEQNFNIPLQFQNFRD